MAKYWTYEKIGENHEPQTLPRNDWDGEITGKIIIDLKSYFDENPELRKQLGWIKHIRFDVDDIDYDSQTQKVMLSSKKVDDYTIEDEYHIIDKTEEQMLYEELGYATSGFFIQAHGNWRNGGL